MKKLLLTLSFILIVASNLYAQTPCPGGQTSVTVKSNAPINLSFCAPTGTPITTVSYYLNGTKTGIFPSFTTTTTNNDGTTSVDITLPIGLKKGQYRLTITYTINDSLFGVLESPQSGPLDLNVSDPPVLTAPQNLRTK